MHELFSQILLPVTIALIMFGMGMSLKKEDFRMLWKKPVVVSAGLAAQMILLPLLAFLIAFSLPLPASVKVGLVLLAAAPGGTISSVVTYWVRGNVALCVVLTSLTSLLIIGTLPLLVQMALRLFAHQDIEGIHLPFFNTLFNVAVVILFPVYTGVLFKKYFSLLASRMEKPYEAVMTGLLALVYVMVIVSQNRISHSNFLFYVSLAAVSLLLNLTAMTGSYYLLRRFYFSHRNSYTIAIQAGLQDTALAIYVASSLMKSNEIAIVPVVYGSFTFFTALIFGYRQMKKDQK